MVFQIQKISNYGSATPAVARTLLQGSEILGFFSATDEQKGATKLVLHELQRHLVRCVEVRDRIGAEISAGREQVAKGGFDFQSNRRAVSLPGVAELQSNAEAFLQSARLAIQATARLVEPFYGARHDHRFHKFIAWSEQKFGADDRFTHLLRHWEPWVKRIVDVRNAVDHPMEQPGGKLVTQNFRFAGSPDAPSLVEPTWSLSGEPESGVLADMDAIIEAIITLGEDILAGLFYKLGPKFPLVIREIPADQRDPSCPKRLRVTLAQEDPST